MGIHYRSHRIQKSFSTGKKRICIPVVSSLLYCCKAFHSVQYASAVCCVFKTKTSFWKKRTLETSTSLKFISCITVKHACRQNKKGGWFSLVAVWCYFSALCELWFTCLRIHLRIACTLGDSAWQNKFRSSSLGEGKQPGFILSGRNFPIPWSFSWDRWVVRPSQCSRHCGIFHILPDKQLV